MGMMGMMDAQEVAAVKRVLSGDRDAFRVLVELHSRTIFRLAYRFMGNEHDADDVVQETFLRAYAKLKDFHFEASLRAGYAGLRTTTASICSTTAGKKP